MSGAAVTVDALTPAPISGVYPYTDLGNAERFRDTYGASCLFCPVGRGSGWYLYDGTRFRPDTLGQIQQLAAAVTKHMWAEAAAMEGEAAKAFVKHVLRSQDARALRNMVALAAPMLAVPPDVLDADPALLNCTNGTLDLRSGTLRPHDRRDRITKLAPVAYDPDAVDAAWSGFLEATFSGDAALVAFLSRLAGVSASGLTIERLVLMIGPAATGKSTFLDAVASTLGDYAMTLSFETFLQRQHVGGVREDIAALAGARLAAAVEVNPDKHLDAALVKHLTGGDAVRARFLFKDSFEFRPQFTLWLAANDAPLVPASDDGIWRRILRVPFAHVVAEEARDPGLKRRLTTEATPAILAWLVRGFADFQAHGLGIPPDIRAVTAAYREDMDPLAGFLADRCALGPYTVSAADLRAAYEAWCRETGERAPLSQKALATALRRVGGEPYKGHANRSYWRGLTLQEAPEAPTR